MTVASVGSRRLAPLLLLLAAAVDPVVAHRGEDALRASEARALLDASPAAIRADAHARLAVIQQALLERALLREAHAQGWDRRPDIEVAARRAAELSIVQSFLQSRTPVAAPTEAEIAEAWHRDAARFFRPRQYHVAQLREPPPANTARARLQALLLPADHPAAFSAAHPGDDLGWIPEDRLLPAIRDAIAGLPEGGVSAPICLADGCHLLHLIATRPAGPAPLAEMHDTIAREITAARHAAAERAYADTLLARTPIAIDEPALARLAAPH